MRINLKRDQPCQPVLGYVQPPYHNLRHNFARKLTNVRKAALYDTSSPLKITSVSLKFNSTQLRNLRITQCQIPVFQNFAFMCIKKYKYCNKCYGLYFFNTLQISFNYSALFQCLEQEQGKEERNERKHFPDHRDFAEGMFINKHEAMKHFDWSILIIHLA